MIERATSVLVAAVGLFRNRIDSVRDVTTQLQLLFSRLNQTLTGVALSLCGPLVCRDPRRHDRAELLAATHTPGTYRTVASRALLTAVTSGILLGIAAGLLVGIGLHSNVLGHASIDALSLLVVTALAVIVTLLVTLGTAVACYELQWALYARRAAVRARQITATLPRAVAFMYALSRSGMPFPQVIRTLAAHESVYGETATAFAVTVREMDRLGTDCITALETLSERTPASELADLTDNLANVLQSGQPLDSYLESQHARYREQAEAEQQPYFDLLSAAAEGYVTMLVVAPLFLVTILSVIGLVVTDTLGVLQVVVFGLLPVATVGFLAGLNRLLASHQLPTADTEESNQPPTIPASASSGDTAQWQTLHLYDRLAAYRRLLHQPRKLLFRNPSLSLVVTLPVGVGWLLGSPEMLPAWAVAGEFALSVAVVLIGICAGYASIYEHAVRRRRRLEQAVPLFLDQLGTNLEAGCSIVESLRCVADSDTALTPELEAVWRDMQLGGTADTALERLARQVRSPAVTGAVTLCRNALHASNDIAPVVTIAANELRARQRRHRQQRKLMVSYLVVIYIAFLVFLGVIAALSAAFIPALETAAQHPTQGSVAGLSTANQPTAAEREAYESLFVQIAVVQAICSGLVAGRLGEGSLRAGVKHVGVLLTVAVIAFTVM